MGYKAGDMREGTMIRWTVSGAVELMAAVSSPTTSAKQFFTEFGLRVKYFRCAEGGCTKRFERSKVWQNGVGGFPSCCGPALLLVDAGFSEVTVST